MRKALASSASMLSLEQLALVFGTCLFVVLSPADTVALGSISGFRVPIADLTAIIVGPAVGTVLIRTWRFSLRDPFVLALAAWLAINVVAAWRSPAGAVAIAKLGGVGWLSLLALAGWFLARDPRTRVALQIAWTATLAAVSGAMIASVVLWAAGFKDLPTLTHLGSLPPGSYPRVVGPFLNPNMACTWLLAALAVALSLSRSLGAPPRQTAVLVGMGTLATIPTLSPGLAGWFAGLGLAHKQLPRSVRMLALSLSAVGMLAMFLATIVLLRSTPEGLQIEVAPRVWVWKGAAETAAKALGLGAGLAVQPAYHAWTTPSGVPQVLTDAHNLYLSILAQVGAPGLIVWLTLMFIALHRARCSDPWLGIGIIGAILVPGLSGSFETARHLWVLVGMAAAGSVIATPHGAKGPGRG